jgi:hypothetical protein
MVDVIKLPSSPHAYSIEEAQALIRRCAEPRPAGDPVKAAIRRASLQLQMPFARVKAIWYGEARRIDSEEMDRLRRGAERAELAHTVAAIEFLTNKALASPSPASHQMISNLQDDEIDPSRRCPPCRRMSADGRMAGIPREQAHLRRMRHSHFINVGFPPPCLCRLPPPE